MTPLISMETLIKMNLLRVGSTVESAEMKQACVEIFMIESEAAAPILFPFVPIQPVELTIDKDAQGVQVIYNKIPLAHEEAVQEYFNRLEDIGVIEPMHGDLKFLSRVEVVPKDKGKKIRVVIDHRKANQAVERHFYPMPNRESLLAKLHGAKWFTKLDLKEAFHHILIHENSRHVFGFMTKKGPRQFCRLPFGASIAPEVFQKSMDDIFRSCNSTLVYLDDILIYAPTKEELWKNQAEVLKLIKHNNLTLNIEKCEYGVSTVTFLGAKISESGIDPDKDKISAIVEFSIPTSIMELRSFLGLVTYIAPHIPNLATIADPLRILIKERPCSKHSEFKMCKSCWKFN